MNDIYFTIACEDCVLCVQSREGEPCCIAMKNNGYSNATISDNDLTNQSHCPMGEYIEEIT